MLNKVLIVDNNIDYIGVNQCSIYVNNLFIRVSIILRFPLLLACDPLDLTVQIYNKKKPLSSLFVKNFYHNFWKQIKLFNH